MVEPPQIIVTDTTTPTIDTNTTIGEISPGSSTNGRVAVIGQSMERVYRYSGELEAQGFQTETFTPNERSSFSEKLDANRQWIRNLMDQGVPIHDIALTLIRQVSTRSTQWNFKKLKVT